MFFRNSDCVCLIGAMGFRPSISVPSSLHEFFFQNCDQTLKLDFSTKNYDCLKFRNNASIFHYKNSEDAHIFILWLIPTTVHQCFIIKYECGRKLSNFEKKKNAGKVVILKYKMVKNKKSENQHLPPICHWNCLFNLNFKWIFEALKDPDSEISLYSHPNNLFLDLKLYLLWYLLEGLCGRAIIQYPSRI